jgi:hypothetical protein
LLAAALMPGSDLDGVRSEPNLERRAKAALEYANAAITASRQSYLDSNYQQALASLKEVSAAADLALESLDATGKNARRSPKPFKNAEKQINELIRRLNSLEADFGVDDRPAVQQVIQRLSEIHDELIVRIMGKKK